MWSFPLPHSDETNRHGVNDCGEESQSREHVLWAAGPNEVGLPDNLGLQSFLHFYWSQGKTAHISLDP